MRTPVHCSPNLRPRYGGWTRCNVNDYRHPDGWTATYVAPHPAWNPMPIWDVRDENGKLIAVISFPKYELP